MWKLMIITYAAMNIQGGPIGEIQHPFEFADKEACEALKGEQWLVRTNKNLIVHDAQCVQVSVES